MKLRHHPWSACFALNLSTRHVGWALGLALALTPALRADIIELADGRKITGTLTRSGDAVIIKSDDGKAITAKPGDIAKVTLTSNLSPEEAATAEWSRMAGQVKAADGLQNVINLYQGFLDKYPDAKQAGEARSTLTMYETLAKSDPVKFRGRWMPRAQVDVVLKQWTDAARPVLALYQAGRLKETLDYVKSNLADDDQNPDVLTLGGLAAYRTNNLPQAKTYFTSLAAADPGSLLAENNLAVIATAQKQNGDAFVHYGKALQIMPDQRLLLDNVAEALYAYLAGGGDKNSGPYRNLAKAYDPAEARMEEALAKQGQARWGATWVSKEQYDRLVKALEAQRDQMSRLDAQYASARNTLASLDAQIKQAAADLDNYAQTINAYTARVLEYQGRSLDATYFMAQRDVAVQNYDRTSRYRAQLQAQFDQLAGGVRDFLAQAERLKAAYGKGGASGQYTGTQRILDWGETNSPPAPVPVAEPAPLPNPQAPSMVITPPPPPAPPVIVPYPVVVPVQGPATNPGHS